MTTIMYRLTILDPELAGTPGQPAGATLLVCADCYGSATPDELDGLWDDGAADVEPHRCAFCGDIPFEYDPIEAGYRDARPDCP